MNNQYDKGMDDCYIGKELPKDPTIEYLQGYGYAESLLYPQKNQMPEQVDNRIQPYPEGYLESEANNE